MTNSHCENIQLNLVESIGTSEIPSDIQNHLKGCHSCTETYQEFTSLSHLYASLEKKNPSLETILKIREMARSYGKKSIFAQGIDSIRAALQRVVSPAPAGVMAMMVLALVVSFKTVNPGISSHDSNFAGSAPLLSSPPSFGLVNQGQSPNFSLGVQNVSNPLTADLTDLGPTLGLEDLEKQWQDQQKSVMEANADALMMRGRRFKAMGRVDLAINDFEKITRFYPEYTYIGDVLMFRAQCYALQGNYDQAVESLSTYAQKFPVRADLVKPMIDQLKNEQAAK